MPTCTDTRPALSQVQNRPPGRPYLPHTSLLLPGDSSGRSTPAHTAARPECSRPPSTSAAGTEARCLCIGPFCLISGCPCLFRSGLWTFHTQRERFQAGPHPPTSPLFSYFYTYFFFLSKSPILFIWPTAVVARLPTYLMYLVVASRLPSHSRASALDAARGGIGPNRQARSRKVASPKIAPIQDALPDV